MGEKEKMTPYECMIFFLNIGLHCFGEGKKDQFLRWVAMARKKNCNIREISYESAKGLLEIDANSAHLMIRKLDFQEINTLPIGIIENINQKEFNKVSFQIGDLMISWELVNSYKKNPCAVLYAEEI